MNIFSYATSLPSLFQAVGSTPQTASYIPALPASVYLAKPWQLTEAQAIDIIQSEAFFRVLTDMKKPAVTAVGSLFDKFVRLFKADTPPPSAQTRKKSTAAHSSYERSCSQETFALSCHWCSSVGCISQMIFETYQDLGWGLFLFKNTPIDVPENGNTHKRCFTTYYQFAFNDMSNDSEIFNLAITLSLGKESQLYRQQQDCLAIAFGPFITSDIKPNYNTYFEKKPSENAITNFTLSQASNLTSLVWNMQVLSFHYNATSAPESASNKTIGLSKAFVKHLQELIDRLTTCEAKIIPQQKAWGWSIGILGSAATAVVLIGITCFRKKDTAEEEIALMPVNPRS